MDVVDLTDAIELADTVTAKWRYTPHGDDMNQAARIIVWRLFDRGERQRSVLGHRAWAAAIDEVRRLTKYRSRAHEAHRSMWSIDYEGFVEPVVDRDPVWTVTADETLRELIEACRDQLDRDLVAQMILNDGGQTGESLAAANGLTEGALTHRRNRLRRHVAELA